MDEQNGINAGRIWWCPTGAFVGMPLHASAPSDQFVPSYTSTLGALLEARSKIPADDPKAPKLGIVGVTHSGPDRKSELVGVQQEVEKITAIFGPTYVTSLVGEQATVDAVKRQIQDCAWIHLACHGKQDDRDPPKSRLQLYGGELELGTILRMPLGQAEFAFLAACQTAMGDARMVNEAFHLAGGFVAAGFQGAIGTMWAMLDRDGPVVADVVYKHLFADGETLRARDAARALQLAVRRMREESAAHERWVPFIHIGI